MLRLIKVLKKKLSKDSPRPAVERRKKRRHRSGADPVVGSDIVYRDLKMRVTATRSPELWKWLVENGWRPANYPNDRRQYRMLPENAYARLDMAASSERPMIIRALTRQ